MTPNQQLQKPTGSMPAVFRFGCAILAGGVALFSLFFVVAAFFDIILKREADKIGVLVGLIVIFGGLAAGGIFAAWKLFRMKPAPAPLNIDLENRILHLAQAKGCRLTVGMVALNCRVSIEESRAALEKMVMQGAATPDVEDDGGIVYDFSDLLPAGKEPPQGGERPLQLP